MKCTKCPFYYSDYTYNQCKFTDEQYFQQKTNCSLVNDDGTLNKDECSKVLGDIVQGLCCDCKYGIKAERIHYGDYSENDKCSYKKVDGSCWKSCIETKEDK
jgi:hypothetical protein